MNKFKTTVACTFTMFFLFACKEKKCVDKIVVKENGKILKKEINVCDNNTVIYEQEFADIQDSIVADGYAKFYYENGKLKSLNYYKKGLEDSVGIEYYKNGEIKEKKYYTSGQFFGPQYNFHENGNINYIDYFTQYGKKWLTINLNDKGHISKIDGRLLHITLSDKSPNIDSLKVRSTLYLINEVPIIPHKKTMLNIKIRKDGTVLYNKTFSDFTSFYNTSVCGFKYEFLEKGTFEYFPTVSIVDSVTGVMFSSDSTEQKIKVY